MNIVLYLLVFLSGAAGLVYEVLWAKYLALLLGGTALAQSAALALFLGGLSAGYAYYGRRADRSRSPILFYAGLEAAIALIGILTPWLFSTRLGLLAVFVSSFLMGGTLPMLTRWTARSLEEMRTSVSLLYFTNSMGAASGGLIAGFFLIPRLGLDASSWAAGAVNLFIAACALLLERRTKRLETPADPERPVSPPAEARLGRTVCFAAFTAGLVSLTFETAWIRLLSQILGSSVYSFSLMLSAFILGISLGSMAVAARALRGIAAHRLLAAAYFGAGASLLCALPAYENLPFLFLKIRALLPSGPDAFARIESAKFLFAFCLMLPTAAFLGAAAPLASRAVTRTAGGVGAGVGTVFGLNAGGNVLGALAGLWLMPTLGVDRLFSLGIALLVFLTFALLSSERPPISAGWRGASLCTVIAALSFAIYPLWDKRPFSFGAFRMNFPGDLSHALYRKSIESNTLLFHKDDREATISVIQSPTGGRALMINGKADASTRVDDRTQTLLAHVPLLLAASLDDILIIGYGSGMTAGAALKHPVGRVDVAEISPTILATDRFFAPENHTPLDDPRLNVRIGDGRRILESMDRRFDAIISEPSNPWIAGMGNLFSREFYENSRSHLKAGGVMAQWFHLYEMDDETLRLTLRTFTSVFPESEIWFLNLNDILLVGYQDAASPDWSRMRRRFERETVREDLARIGIGQFTTLLSLHMLPAPAVRAMAGSGPVNTDRFPRLEYSAPKAFFSYGRAHAVFAAEDSLQSSHGPRPVLERFLASGGAAMEKAGYQEIFQYHGSSRHEFLRSWLEHWKLARPQDGEASRIQAGFHLSLEHFAEARAIIAQRLESHPDEIETLEFAVELETRCYAKTNSPDAALRAKGLLERLRTAPGSDLARVHVGLARLYRAQGERRRALEHFIQAARGAGPAAKIAPDVLWMEAASLALKLEDRKTLVECLEAALTHNPNNPDGLALLDILQRPEPPEAPE